MRGGGGGVSLLPVNPDNVAAGGATDARCGEGGSWRWERSGMKRIKGHSNPYSSFSLSFCPLCIRRGFDKKFCTRLCRTWVSDNVSNKMKLDNDVEGTVGSRKCCFSILILQG